MINELNKSDINRIQDLAREKLGICRKDHDIIGMQIFIILRKYARVIYYPLGKEAPWGFTRISGKNTELNNEKPFVAINSSIPVDCQVFAAAHELYHIWFEHKPDILPSDLLHDYNKEINEKKANRFAAEFLVDELLLRQEIGLLKIKKYTIKNVLQLAELFMVPYRMMVKRLFEINVINKNERDRFLAETEETIDQYRKRYSITLPPIDNRIVIDNLVELAVAAYDKQYITYERLEYLLRICDLRTEEIGIIKSTEYEFPSDDELDSIMEE